MPPSPFPWAALPLGLFALLNFFLAFMAPTQAQGTAGASFVFAVAGAAIGLGLWRGQPLLVGLGIVLGMGAPVWMGRLMSGNVNPLHIVVRAGLAALFFWIWLRSLP